MTGLVIAVVVLGAVCGYLIWALLECHTRSRAERRELEDRLMAICEPVPLTQVMAVRDPSPAKLAYVDEEPQGRTTAKVREDG